MSQLMQANREWSTRPADQRFVSLVDLNAHCQYMRDNSKSAVVSSRAIKAVPVDHDTLAIAGPQNMPIDITHWAFGQLAQRAGAPANYLRELPAEMAADCINYGMMKRDIDDVKCLLYKNGGNPQMRAITGPNYGRIWNSTITTALVKQYGDGISSHWRVPGEFGKQVTITKDNTTLYASDRDMFVFLADEDRRIELPNRRNGKSGSLARGFFLWNSETGAQTFGLATFLFDYACCNRIVWGAEQFQEIKIRHTASAPDRWLEEVKPAINAYSESSDSSIIKSIEDARQKKVSDIDTFLLNRFTKSQANGIKAAHLQDEQRPIETVWDSIVGITAYARNLQFQDARVDLERKAGKLLAV
jgi:hypothetical protein